MGSVNKFLKGDMVKRENTTFPVTRAFLDENGKPALWTVRPISIEENAEIRSECITEKPIVRKGKNGRMKTVYKDDVDISKYQTRLICASVVEPNLYDAQRQDSFGVKTPEELIKKMIPYPGEFDEFAMFLQQYNGFDESFTDAADEVKNG